MMPFYYGSSPIETLPPEEFIQTSTSAFKANVFRLTLGDSRVVVKDYSKSNPLIRATVCRYLLNKEVGVLKQLIGVAGVPQYLGAYGEYGYVMHDIDGKIVSETESTCGKCSVVAQLDKRVKLLHGLGITHNDIRTRNMICGTDGVLYLIDFAGAILHSKKRGLLSFVKNKFYQILSVTESS